MKGEILYRFRNSKFFGLEGNTLFVLLRGEKIRSRPGGSENRPRWPLALRFFLLAVIAGINAYPAKPICQFLA